MGSQGPETQKGSYRCGTSGSQRTLTADLHGRSVQGDTEHNDRPPAPRVWLTPAAVWELLDRLEIPQNQLARLVGISPGHPSLLMNAKRSPASCVRRRFMRALAIEDFHRLFILASTPVA